MSILENCPEDDADAREQFWISNRQVLGFDLTNCTNGGGGIRGHRHSLETRKKIGDAHRGKIVSPETCVRVSVAKRGKKLSAETRAKLIGRKGREISAKERAAISSRMKGNQVWRLAKHSTKRAKAVAKKLSGELGSNAKMTNAQAIEARRLFAEGAKQAELMRLFNVSRVDIHRVVRGKTYKYLEGEVPVVAHRF